MKSALPGETIRTMAHVDELLWAKLRELDDPTHLERPADFDEAEADTRFAVLVRLVEAAFRCECTTDAGRGRIQDASFYGDLVVPASATETRCDLAIRVSNFGPMATFSVLGRRDADSADVAAADSDRIENALASAGYLAVPMVLLRTAYDGPTDSSPFLYTWWSRFFEYV